MKDFFEVQQYCFVDINSVTRIAATQDDGGPSLSFTFDGGVTTIYHLKTEQEVYRKLNEFIIRSGGSVR